MQLFQFVLTIMVVYVSAAPSLENAEMEWNDFKMNHGKQYRSLSEELKRKEIFIDNYNQIFEHNIRYRQGLVSFTLKINEYSDMSNKEIKTTLNGYRKATKNLERTEDVLFVPDQNLAVPDEFDWREIGAVTSVENQGQCGSCWSFSSTGALEGQHFLKTGNLVSLSEQNLVDCSHENFNDGCNGGDMVSAFTYVNINDGIDSEESYPYEAHNNICRYNPSYNVTSTKGYASIENGNEEYLKAAVATIGPIAVAIDASRSDFRSYASGIYYNENCSSGSIDPENELDHAVLAVGYGTQNGQDYWLIKNSWGTTWGDDGYIKMARNRNNNCGVAAAASFPLNY